MASPHCGICEYMGYRSCDLCGQIVFSVVAGQPELCQFCEDDLDAASSKLPDSVE